MYAFLHTHPEIMWGTFQMCVWVNVNSSNTVLIIAQHTYSHCKVKLFQNSVVFSLSWRLKDAVHAYQ